MSFTVDIKIADSAQVKEVIATLGERIAKLSAALEETLEWFDGDRSRLRELSALLSAPDIAAWRAKHQALAAAVKQLDDARTHEEQGYGFNALSAAAREVVG